MNRRRFLGGLAAVSAGVFTGRLFGSGGEESDLVVRTVEGPSRTYFCYPHGNGFWPGSNSLVGARKADESLEFFSFDLASAVEQSLVKVDGADMYYTVSNTGTMALTARGTLYAIDLAGTRELRAMASVDSGAWWMNVSDIAPDGSKIAVMRKRRGDGGECVLESYDVGSGVASPILQTSWFANHIHFSPFDPTWVSFCHEGPTKETRDRLWAWNAQAAPEGMALFDQIAADGKPLFVGHERAMFTEPAILFVAFGDSDGSPRGLYKSTFQGATALVSEGNRDWHCNASRDGRWAVVDTTGPSDRPGNGWQDAGSTSDILAVNLKTGKRSFLARTRHGQEHPYHPHPHISPDGRWVVFNDGRKKCLSALEINQQALEAFLS